MTEIMQKFLSKIAEIKAEKPTYRQPGFGADGTCDCIGLVIGAVRRMGLKWTGIHGTNWAMRREMTGMRQISSAAELSVGDLVYKARPPGHSKYALPARYRKGGQYYNGDLNDYYHVGVVTSVSPLQITHMTSPTVRVDTTLGAWAYTGSLTMLLKASGQLVKQPIIMEGTQIPASGKTARVVAPTGKTVKMRQRPTTQCGVYDDIPIGTIVRLDEPGEKWAKISYGSRKGWYMMAKFLEVQ